MTKQFDNPKTVREVHVKSDGFTEAQALASIFRMGLYENTAYMRRHVAALSMIYAACFEDFSPFDVEMLSIHELVNHGYITAKVAEDTVSVTVLPFIP